MFLRDGLGKVETVLCLGAHPDDIEIGCGGTLLTLLEYNPNLQIHWVIFTSTPERKTEANASFELFLTTVDKRSLTIKEFRDGFLPWNGEAVKNVFESLKDLPNPDIIFTHTEKDSHQDHRQVCELTWNTFRNHLILEYEIPKWEGDLQSMNSYFPISKQNLEKKIKNLHQAFSSQATKDWFEADVFKGLARLRGLECRAPEKFAEAFIARKMTF